MPAIRRRDFLAGTAAVTAAGLTAFAHPDDARAAEPGTVAARPNILVIVTDDQPLHTAWATPKTLDWIAGEGVIYANGYAATPLCAPSRSSIFSGRYAHNHGVLDNGHPHKLDQQATVQRYLKQAGYRTGLYGKYLNAWNVADNPPHFDEFALLDPVAYNDGQYNVNGTVRTIAGYSTTVLKDQALQFLQRSTTDQRPWFLYVAPKAPHGPNTPEPKYANTAVPAWNGRPSVPEGNRADKPQYIKDATGTLADGQAIRTAQLRTLLSVDDAVQALRDKLAALGQLDNTLVFYIGDNGYGWADHGWTKKSVPYSPSIKVPFYVSWPAGGLNSGATSQRLVANIDIAPTILDAAGITPPAPLDGRSLLSGPARDRILTEWWKSGTGAGGPHTWSSHVTATTQYTEYRALHTDGAGNPVGTGNLLFREYYDLTADPHQLTNLLYQATPAQEQALGIPALAAQLAADRQSSGASAP
ncbi:sulfatase family protein [Longispora urticae]